MFITIEQLADLIDGCELREIDQGFSDLMCDEFLDATDHLDTVLCDEADEIYVRVEREMKIRYLREFFAEGNAKGYKLNLLTKMLNAVQVDGNIFAREFLPIDQIELVGQLNPAALDYQYPASLVDNCSSRFSVVSEILYGEYCNSLAGKQPICYRDWLLWRLDVLYQDVPDGEFALVVMDQILAVEGQLSVLYGIDTGPNSPLFERGLEANSMAKEVV